MASIITVSQLSEMKCSNLRIVHQHVDVPKLLGQAGDEAADLLGVAHVELDGQHLDAVADLLDDVVGDLAQGLGAARREHQLQALRRRPRELESRAAPDARGRPRDHDSLALEALGYGGRHGSVQYVATTTV